MVNFEEEYDKKLTELRTHIQALNDKANAGDLQLMSLAFIVAKFQGKKCPDDWVEIMDGQGNPTNNFKTNNES